MDKVHGKVPQDVQREIQVLSENDHPFLLHMVKSLQTPSKVYILSELVGGGELHAAMRTIPTLFTRSQAMFYIGSLLLMIEAMQERNVVYRDLKPENIMLDTEGYLKLIDFGTAKKLDAKCGRTFTPVGTTHYMAPEIMRGKGYGLEVDVWALGVVLFELMCGSLPFGQTAESDREVCKAVLAGKPSLPPDLEPTARQLIVLLLEPRPRRRLGCGAKGLQEIKAAPFFAIPTNGKHDGARGDEASDDYLAKLLSRTLTAPIRPPMQVPQDVDEEGQPVTDADELRP